MQLTEFEWSLILAAFGIIGTLAGLAITIISFFLKRTMGTVDGQGKDIQAIKENHVTEEDLKSTRTELGTKIAAHDQDINEIKRTYVTKDELKDIKTELRDETKLLAADVAEIKNNYLTKDDYYRRQVETDRKLDQIYTFLMNEKGGRGNGQK